MRNTLLILGLILTLAGSGLAADLTPCSACSTSGKCHVCEGDGLRYDGSVCSTCSGSKKCYYCGGQGKY